ncbi:MAG: molybdopterin molybdotransferase MoeA [Streptococcaceae bacterium]|nr:molybdopterin molybdotransferase MoeA [Streptococcaceae bacterium]
MYLERQAISLEQAQALLSGLDITPKTEIKKVNESHEQYLAEDVVAPFPIPAFRRSGYDGYGILSEDDQDFPREFEILENVAAGQTFDANMKSGQAVRIMTGAKVPNQVGKVIKIELTVQTSEGKVKILESMKSTNISKIGEEVEQGEVILKKGTKLNAGAISVLNAFGREEITVYQKPKMAIIATGSELLKPGEAFQEGKIYNSNGPLLTGLARENGADIIIEQTLADKFESTWQTLKDLAQKVDLIITTGGVSVGDFDFMAKVAKESDQFLFNKLAMRPGSPTTAFVLDGTPVVALSGNPSACFTGFYFFAEPLIKKMQGTETSIKKGTAVLQSAYSKRNEYDRYLNGVLEDNVVALHGHGQSSELASLYLSNCFFEIPHGTIKEAGEQVVVWKIQ